MVPLCIFAENGNCSFYLLDTVEEVARHYQGWLTSCIVPLLDKPNVEFSGIQEEDVGTVLNERGGFVAWLTSNVVQGQGFYVGIPGSTIPTANDKERGLLISYGIPNNAASTAWLDKHKPQSV